MLRVGALWRIPPPLPPQVWGLARGWQWACASGRPWAHLWVKVYDKLDVTNYGL